MCGRETTVVDVDVGELQKTATAFPTRNALIGTAARLALHAARVQQAIMGRKRLVAVLGRATSFAILVIARGNGVHGLLAPPSAVVAPDTSISSTSMMRALEVVVAIITTARRKPKPAILTRAQSTVKGSGANTVNAPQLVDQGQKRERSACP